MLIRRFGRPGLLGLAARTAVVAGTATATAGAIRGHQMRKAEEQQEAAAYEQQYVPQAAPVAAQQPAVQSPGSGLTDKIKELAELHSSGALTDAEFSAAKQQLLGV
ncbi:putative oligomerization/nucleic acid binding protein [Microterricola gilva]|uniref:Putative oligomerization/nucleic acid binding protein n=1 Tax=Microterricola gilva TaxID=393267 RepID=A0A4Q8AR50_9MICO|nr:SHOCT domain-containing protein [Microterricola gilva]RZU66701.1 putative oligomerization/nucleic acid binding protein [Microterricola gilva]